MRLFPMTSPKTWALVGTGCILALLALVGATAFRRNVQDIVKKTVGVDMCEREEMNFAPPPPSALSLKFSAGKASATESSLDLLPQKLIRTARLGLEVKDFPRFEKACRALAGRYGYLADLRITDEEGGRKRADLTLRIAAEKFDGAIAEFKTLGTVKKEEVSVEDVTRAYADLEARRANKRIAATRLRELIANRTGKLSDVIEAEQALSQVTEELESMEAQKRAMDGQIQYSTLRADVAEPPLPPKFNERTLWEPIAGALKDGRSGLISSFAFVLEVLIVCSPWLLLSVLGFWGFRRWRAAHPRTPEITVLS
ncbi:MAG: DUF4349 domain-containing protein [Holophaga sp.]|nr:DUF4349 domain-containing protein [Holophaga sp.]